MFSVLEYNLIIYNKPLTCQILTSLIKIQLSSVNILRHVIKLSKHIASDLVVSRARDQCLLEVTLCSVTYFISVRRTCEKRSVVLCNGIWLVSVVWLSVFVLSYFGILPKDIFLFTRKSL